ncbi:MAG: amidohydrolase family protein [Nocardioidaceae bacterium]
MDASTVAALVTAGHREEMLVLAHATDRVSAELAVRAGVDGLAHVVVNELPESDLVATAVERNLFVIPTLVVLEAICGRFSPASMLDDERVASYLSPLSRMMIENASWPATTNFRRDFSVSQTLVKRLHDAGVTILAGTDAGSPGGVHGVSIHRELRLLVEAGLSPSEALTAATAAPAARFGLRDRGRIASGMVADLLLVQGDPTMDITATNGVAGIWRHGVRLDREAPRIEAAP